MTETGSERRPAMPPPEMVAVGTLVRATPALARLGFSMWWRSTVWGFNVSREAATRLAQAAMRNESPAELLQSTRDELLEYGRRLLGTIGVATEPITVDPTPEPNGAAPAEAKPEAAATAAVSTAAESSNGTAASLRARGADLLRRAADVGNAEEMHPAYARILGELAPDEGRILRFLAVEGPQPAVDVRTNRPLNVGSQMVAPLPPRPDLVLARAGDGRAALPGARGPARRGRSQTQGRTRAHGAAQHQSHPVRP